MLRIDVFVQQPMCILMRENNTLECVHHHGIGIHGPYLSAHLGSRARSECCWGLIPAELGEGIRLSRLTESSLGLRWVQIGVIQIVWVTVSCAAAQGSALLHMRKSGIGEWMGYLKQGGLLAVRADRHQRWGQITGIVQLQLLCMFVCCKGGV